MKPGKNKQQREFQALMEAAGWSQAETARRLNFTRSAVSQILSGKNTPDPRTLDLLRRLVVESATPQYRVEPQREPVMVAREEAKSWGGPYWGTRDEAPVVSMVCAGNAMAWEVAGHDAPRIKVNCKDPNCYCVEVWGDSMETVYHAGDILVIAPNAAVHPNDLVVFKTEDDEPFFKKYLGLRNGVHRFASLNPNYPVMEIKEGKVKVHPVHSVIRPLKGKIY